MNTALISYNTFVDGEQNGWKDHGGARVLLIQNKDGKWLGVGQNNHGNSRKPGEYECEVQVANLFGDLVEALPTLDKVFFYVGSYGAELAIELAAKHGLSPDRAVFVLCGCNMEKKMEMIRRHGFSSSETVRCDCGGHKKMLALYYKAMGLQCAQPKCPFRVATDKESLALFCSYPACPFRKAE